MRVAAPHILATFLINGVEYLGSAEVGVDEDWADGQVSEPDIHWSHVDGSGHFHAFDTYSRELPTLRATPVHIPCNGDCPDGGCDGYSGTWYFCPICDEQVEPKWNTVTRTVKTGELHWWKATVRGPAMMPGGQVSVRIQNGNWPERFGIAVVTGADINCSDNTAELELTGNGRLGFRPLPESKGDNQ